jgi:hypothetical protein
MLDELAHAGAEHLDEAFIAGYDRNCEEALMPAAIRLAGVASR